MKSIQLSITREFKQHFNLFALSLFCCILLLIRAKITNSIFFFFLIWNLFLAYTPLAVTSLITNNISLIDKRRYLYPAILCWLLLLPNAPYLITDFLHLKKEAGVPVWFDVLLLISFTLCGLLFGLASMKNMYNILTIKFTKLTASVSMSLTCVLCGFGMYVGRFLRYNSWDILNRPISLTADIFDSLFSIDTYRAAWGITLGFGMLMYLLFSLYNSNNDN
jgi:uncharacterized membrane protein